MFDNSCTCNKRNRPHKQYLMNKFKRNHLPLTGIQVDRPNHHLVPPLRSSDVQVVSS